MANIRISAAGRRFGFGKYEGRSVRDVIRDDPSYVEYLVSRNCGWLFTAGEMQSLRNLRSREGNADILMENARCRNAIEEEMYRVFRREYLRCHPGARLG